MNPRPDPLIGRQLGSYQITQALGQGKLARLYRARHITAQHEAVIKIITWGLGEDEALTARFKQEARALTALHHPNIVPTFDFGLYHAGYYLAMEYVDGQSLEQLIASGNAIPVVQIRSIIADLAAALDAAHAAGIAHGNLKPANVILSGPKKALLGDFSLPALAPLLPAQRFSDPYYLPPELALSVSAPSPAADIYALGVVLFELISGTPPYVADSSLGVTLKHLYDPIPNIQDFVPETPDTVRAVIQKALAKEPSQRFQTAAEMAQILARAWDTGAFPVVTTTPMSRAGLSPVAPPAQRARRLWNKPARLVGGVLTVTVLIMFAAGVWLNLRRPSPDATPTIPLAANLPTVTSTLIPQTPTIPPAASATPTLITFTATALLSATKAPPPSQTPTLVPTEVATATPTPSPTLADTPTPQPAPATPTGTPTTEEALVALRGKILFKTNRTGRVEIYQMNADGSEQKPLKPDRAYLYNEAVRWEAFSADRGETIAVRGEGQLDLWRVNIADGIETRITTADGADYDPVWSPVDNRIAFVSERTGSGDLYVVDLDGNGEMRLTLNEGVFDKHPSWSPDGAGLVFWSNRGEAQNWQIWLSHLDGQMPVNLSKNAFKDWDPVWVK